MDRWTQRRATVVVGCVYLALMAVVVWSPVPLTGSLAPLLDRFDSVLHGLLGTPLGTGNMVFDFVMNVIMFVPPALLLALRMRRGSWHIVVLIGFLVSLMIEMVQLQFLAERSATISDVVANTLGAYVGAVLSFGLRSWFQGLRSRASGSRGDRDRTRTPG